MARWATMRRHLRRTGAARGCFMSLDHLSLPLSLGLGGGKSQLDGVLFRPSVHYRQLGGYRPSWPERLRDWRKAVLYRRMLRNRSLRSVLSLDPFFPAYAAARYRDGAKVVALPDPVCHRVPESPDAQGRAPVDGARKRFLLFGHLTERKGVLVLLDALALLDRDVAAAAQVVLAGAIDPAIRRAVFDRLHSLQTHQPDLILTAIDRRLPCDELQAMVEDCDVVLAPYQRFVGSSGVLLWAASAGKPVLTQDFGLLGRLVSDYGLGIAVDTTSAAAIAAALGHIIGDGAVQDRFDRAAAERFVAERSPERFAASIFTR
jgi:glycosyltransferase involved in cell wall biosynthesis